MKGVFGRLGGSMIDLAVDGRERAVVRFEEHAAVGRFDDDAAGDRLLAGHRRRT